MNQSTQLVFLQPKARDTFEEFGTMKMLSLALAATSVLALGAGAAAAQSWMSINDRQDRLETRIEAGVRSGDLTRVEARQLRADFDALARLEARYRVNGLSAWERQDLDRRFDELSMRIRMERADVQERDGGPGWFGGRGLTDNRGQWVSLERRKIQLDRRIERGLENGRLTPNEAARLRADFDAIARLEYRYRRGGLTAAEMADLDRRFDVLAARIRFERQDGQRYGYNNRY
jgi:hypothetical protein